MSKKKVQTPGSRVIRLSSDCGNSFIWKTKKEEHIGMAINGSSFFDAWDYVLLNRASGPRP